MREKRVCPHLSPTQKVRAGKIALHLRARGLSYAEIGYAIRRDVLGDETASARAMRDLSRYAREAMLGRRYVRKAKEWRSALLARTGKPR